VSTSLYLGLQRIQRQARRAAGPPR
jgi:hypothetical protein